VVELEVGRAGRPVIRAGQMVFVALLVLIPSAMVAQADSLRFLSELEREIIREHNRVRSDPGAYAGLVRAIAPRFDGLLFYLSDNLVRETQEGVTAVYEAAKILEATAPLPRMIVSRGMSLGAHDLVADHGPKGRTGHVGSDGSQSWDRVTRYGEWDAAVAENIAYGYETARELVIQLLVDDGVPDRVHRVNILDPVFRVVGVACGPHETYKVFCVVTYAGGYTEQP
jgi:hypothetical protein